MILNKSSIIIKLKGGLGNQIFQFAAAYTLAKQQNINLIIDTTYLSRDSFRKYELHNLNLEYRVINSNLKRRLFIFFNLISTLRLPIKFFEVEEFKFKSVQNNNNRLLIMDGYFQNTKYFSDSKDDLIHFFNINYDKCEILNNIKNTESVALHIRRGDYVNNSKTNQIHGICNLEYYNRALSFFSDHKYIIYIFSDDIEWVRKNIKLTNQHHFISENTESDFQEFILMKNCKNFIISNSTFSWWAAWLANNHNKKVICPKNWFKDENLNQLSKSLIPQDWIKF